MQNKNKGKSKILKILGFILLFIVVVVIGIYIKVNSDINQLTESIVVEDVSIRKIRDKDAEVDKGEPLNILLLGTDANDLERTEEEGYISRSDTIMIVSLNPQTQTTKMLSIPRDTLAYIDGIEEPDKINHAYAFGGIESAIETVQNYLNLPIDYYAVLDMSALEDLIDAIGGIEVKSPLTFTYRGTQFKEGETREVNGVKAMNFARMRYDDPEGEVGRQNRQKIVIKAIMDKLLSLNAVTYYPAILQVVAENVKTNFDLTTILSVYPKYVDALKNMSAIQFDDMQPLYLDEIFYFNIPLTSRVKVSNELRSHTNMDPIQISTLRDPIESNENNFIKTETIVMNQYPNGLTDEEIAEINASQESLQKIRDLESSYIEPPVNYNNEVPTYTEPVYQTPAPPVAPVTISETQAPVVVPTEPVVTQPPVEYTEPPVVSEQPVVTEVTETLNQQ